MRRTLCRLTLATVLVGAVITSASSAGASSTGSPAHKTRVALLADGVTGKDNAVLGQQVVFGAIAPSLGSNEAIIIVDLTHKEMLGLCTESPCEGTLTSDKADTRTFRAFVLGKADQLIAKSNLVTVEWKQRRILVHLSDPAAALPESPAYIGSDALDGVPITGKVELPEGAATSWSTLTTRGNVDGPNGIIQDLTKTCGPGSLDGCAMTLKVPSEESGTPGSVTRAGVTACAYNAAGAIQTCDSYEPASTAFYRQWRVKITATNDKTGETGSSVKLASGETATVKATIDEPRASGLLKYVGHLEIDDGVAGGAMLANCEHKLTCQYTVKGDGLAGKLDLVGVVRRDPANPGPDILGYSLSPASVNPAQPACPRVASRTSGAKRGHTSEQACPSSVTFTLKPGLSAADQYIPARDLTGISHIDVSGTIWSSGSGNTVCDDALYQVQLNGEHADCGGTWPSFNPNVTIVWLGLAPPGCQNIVCTYVIKANDKLHPFSPGHTYKGFTLGGPASEVASGNGFTGTGKFAFWAYPFGAHPPNVQWGGQFTVTLYYK